MQNSGFSSIISVPVGLFPPAVRKSTGAPQKPQTYLVNGRPQKATARKVWGDTGIAMANEPFSL